MNTTTRKAILLREASTEVPAYWNQAPDKDEDEFGVFTFELGAPLEAFDYGYDPNRVWVDWVFVARDPQRATELEHAAYKALSGNKRSTQVETGPLPDADKVSHYARRRFNF